MENLRAVIDADTPKILERFHENETEQVYNRYFLSGGWKYVTIGEDGHIYVENVD